MIGRNRAAATLIAVALMTQACSGSGSTPAPSVAAPSEAAASGASAVPSSQTQPAEPVTVVYWSMFSEGEPLQIELAKAIVDFQAENPNIKVNVNWVGRDVLSGVQGAMAAGTQVDIVDQDNSSLNNALVKTDLALALDPYLDGPGYDGKGAWRDVFNDGTFDQSKGADGKTYMIPRDDYTRAFFTNTAVLAKAGVTPKTYGMTWDEFTSMLATLKAAGVNPIGADGTETDYNQWWFENLAVRIAGLDAFLAAAKDKTGAAWSAPEFLKAAQMLRDLIDKGYFNKGYEGSVWPAAQAPWVNGKTALMLMGAWLPKEMMPQAPAGFESGMFAFPSVAGGKGNDLVERWSNAYLVLKSTKVPDQAVRLVQYLMSPKVGTQIAKAGTPVPIKGVTPPPALVGQYEILANMHSVPSDFGLLVEAPEWFANVYLRCDDPLFQGKSSPEAFITCMKDESAKYWSTH
jgi:raffinose/stachyose/melibiose transport system substrate-binding protein